ncbi:uncharacterized protein LOC129940227, partial [Eupeodes corollae]|uniref:uncharacterized protein LOC129940227 n=1 Tax=Eupeodes corollae TaxID=290404 RepID=UPI0024933C9B
LTLKKKVEADSLVYCPVDVGDVISATHGNEVIDDSFENHVVQTWSQNSISNNDALIVNKIDSKRDICTDVDVEYNVSPTLSVTLPTISSDCRPRRKSNQIDKYNISPIHSDESDVDLSDNDPTYYVGQENSSKLKNFTKLASTSNRNSSSRNNSSPCSFSSKKKASSRSLSGNSSSSSSSSSSTSSASTNSSSSSCNSGSTNKCTNKKDGSCSIPNSRKRKINPTKWKQTAAKIARNSGQAYTSMSKSKRQIKARSVKPPCSEKCRFKCRENFNEDQRLMLFNKFWEFNDINLQRSYINSCMTKIAPKYRYSNAPNPRAFNHAFYFTVDNGKRRVCKTFFLQTLDVTDRVIRTIKSKIDDEGFVQKDLRGKHNGHITVGANIIQDMKDHINSIPRIESHYLRAQTTREYIDGSRTITELYRDYMDNQKQNNKSYGKFNKFYEIFNTEFNISFFKPKKDQCDLCNQYLLCPEANRQDIQEKYDTHLEEKVLSREEKRKDRDNVSETTVCAVFDLQAVMQCPRGDICAFYYKSRLNSFNFTIVELDKSNKNKKDSTYCCYKNVNCYFWDETQGKRGSNELGSCLFNFLQSIDARSAGQKVDVIFYSDNCGGQNKNKFIASLCSFAVVYFENINTITHKFLIQGHTENEGDNVHSLIEKEVKKSLKSSPIYIPQQYVTFIRTAKKHGSPFVVHELDYNYFYDLKNLQDQWGYNYSENEDREIFTWGNVKMLKFVKEDPFYIYYKTSYKEDFKRLNVRNKRKKMRTLEEIELQKLFSHAIELSTNKKKDLSDLLKKHLIPNAYAAYYKSFI